MHFLCINFHRKKKRKKKKMHPGMAIDASLNGDRCIPGWRLMHPGMVIIASRDGDLEMTIDASRDGDRSIPVLVLHSTK